MSAVIPSKEALERDWLDFESTKPPLTTSYKLQRTTSSGVLTHLRMPDSEIVRPQDLPKKYGFTYDQWSRMRASLDRMPVKPETEYCKLGSIALTLEAFEAGHQNIQLGQE